MDIEIVAEGLGFPEGPVIMEDGSVILVEIARGCVTNICFGGVDMQDAWISLSSTGKLAKCRWPEPGLKLNFYA